MLLIDQQPGMASSQELARRTAFRDAPAYVIFTSGSTGDGCLDSLLDLYNNMTARLTCTMLLWAPLSSIQEPVTALCTGSSFRSILPAYMA
jgi:hypothetical protein